MYKEQYAVVKDVHTKTFRNWHDTEEEASAEAERLCRLERVPFYVIKTVGYCHIEETPVTRE